MRALPRRWRIAVILAVAIAALGIAFVVPPMAQDPIYHDFADQRGFWGIPNFSDVVSNAPFLLVGGFGLAALFGRSARRESRPDLLTLPFAVYFAAVGLVALGSTYYHQDPSNETLFWDRVPMSIAFMALFAAIIIDRIDEKAGRILLPVLIVLGIASVVYWHLTERTGNGDLRLYALVQFFPMLAVPLICLLFPPRRLDCRYLVPMFLLYGAAKVFEHFDDQIFMLLGPFISGHSLKHLFAAMAALMALPMLNKADGSDIRGRA
ncbi:MAG: ceramidase domain-containing protein [Gammaproteobacteria bacterium]